MEAANLDQSTTGDRLRVVFFGTPAFAVPTLERLAADAGFDVALAVTQPDRPAGRGRRVAASPVKEAAQRFRIPTYQPESLREPAPRAPLEAIGADLFVVAAYGRVFGPKTLAIPRVGCVNVHASLLPRYRGASPIPAAILAGDERTGVSLMVMDEGLDTGPVVATAATTIARDDTTASLTDRLAALGASIAVENLPGFARGELPALPQPVSGASVTRPLVKADGWLDWARPAVELERRVRAMWPWPRAWTTIGDEPLQVHHAAAVVGDGAPARPGMVEVRGPAVLVGCGIGRLALETVQPAGGRAAPGSALVAGRRVRTGDRLGEHGAPEMRPLVTWIQSESGQGST